jgi:hypothetical protein
MSAPGKSKAALALRIKPFFDFCDPLFLYESLVKGRKRLSQIDKHLL